MKNRFKHYHINEELDNIYKNAIIVLDTNSLLNIYRYNESNRKKYLEILKKVNKRIYLTNQICCEFYKNRLLIIENRSTFKDNIFEMINENQTRLINILENCTGIDKYNSSLSILKHENDLKNEIIDITKKSVSDTQSVINNFRQELDLTYLQKKDPLLENITSIIDSKVGKEFTIDELNEIYAKGKERFEKKTPPGYKDIDKEDNDKYNDLVIWFELHKLSRELDKNILFISDDRKEDWAHKFKGKDLGPRNELIKEFIIETNNLFYSITTKRFIEIISEIHSISDTELLIQETENIQKNIYEKELLQKQLLRSKLGTEKNKFDSLKRYYNLMNYYNEYYNKKQNSFDNPENDLNESIFQDNHKLKKTNFDNMTEDEVEQIKRKINQLKMQAYLREHYLDSNDDEKEKNDFEND